MPVATLLLMCGDERRQVVVEGGESRLLHYRRHLNAPIYLGLDTKYQRLWAVALDFVEFNARKSSFGNQSQVQGGSRRGVGRN